MYLGMYEGQETLISGLGAVPDELYDDEIIKEFFWEYTDPDKTEDDSSDKPAKHIALICFYRKSLHSTPAERHQFFSWVNAEFRKRVSQGNSGVHARSQGDKLVIVQHIKHYQKKNYYEYIDHIYSIVKTEKFLQHCENVYWLADNYESEDMYEILSSEGNGEDIEADNSRAWDAWFHDRGSNRGVGFSDDEDEEKELEAKYWAEYKEFWKQFPVYNNDCRQCLIHQKLKESREFSIRYQEEVRKRKLAEKKSRRKKHRRHR